MSVPVTLTVRGALASACAALEAARTLHNATAGSPQGIEMARSLGDLSHVVYVPRTATAELLFLDVWCDADGIAKLFANPAVQKSGGELFASRDAAIWMPARAAFGYHLPGEGRYLGMIRGPIASPEKAIELFAAADARALRAARLRGIVSHELFIRVGAPGDAPELLGLDVWSSEAGMMEHYADQTHLQAIAPAFSGRPDATTWERAPGAWSEW